MLTEQSLLRQQKKGTTAFLDTAWKPCTFTGSIFVKRGTEIQCENMRPSDRGVWWKRGKGAWLRHGEDGMGFRAALDTLNHEVLLWAERPVCECCPKAGGFKLPGMQIWEMTKVCNTMGSLEAAVGPRTAITRRNNTVSSIQRRPVSKRTSLKHSSFCQSKCGRRNKTQSIKIHQSRTMGKAR